jgi:hypothetical protein
MSELMTVTVKCPYCELEPDRDCPICDGMGEFRATREEIDREYGMSK